MTEEERKEYNKAYREKNKERIKEYYEKNKESIKEYKKSWLKENKERQKEYHKAWREKNKEKVKENNKAYYKGNKEYHKEYCKANRDKLTEYQNKYRKERRKTDPLYRLSLILRASSYRAWKGEAKPKKTEELLGCTYNDFKDYITAQFVGNMTWGNYGDVWHVDHITPLSVIKDVSQTELIESLCHFSNLQPLFAEDNLSKHGKLDYEYPAIYKTNLLHNSNKK
jgi:hypothetical protein